MQNTIVKKMLVVSVVSVSLGASVYAIGANKINHKQIRLSYNDKYLASKTLKDQMYISQNGKDIVEGRNKRIADNYAKNEVNDLIMEEYNNPTKVHSKITKESLDKSDAENSPTKTINASVDNEIYNSNSNIQKIIDVVENSNESQMQEGRESREKDGQRYLIDREKLIKNNINPDVDINAYNKGREDEVMTTDQYYNSPEFKKEYDRKWKEIEDLYKNNNSTAAAQNPTNRDSVQRLKSYDRGRMNSNPRHINPEHILNKNIYVPSGLSAEEFEKALSGTALEGLGQAFVDMENNWGVDGLFCMAVGFHESANGYSRLAVNNNNLFGMKSKNGWKKFDSKYDCIVYFGEYMNKDLYKGKSVYEIGHTYCPSDTDQWFDGVNRHYQNILSKI